MDNRGRPPPYNPEYGTTERQHRRPVPAPRRLDTPRKAPDHPPDYRHSEHNPTSYLHSPCIAPASCPSATLHTSSSFPTNPQTSRQIDDTSTPVNVRHNPPRKCHSLPRRSATHSRPRSALILPPREDESTPVTADQSVQNDSTRRNSVNSRPHRRKYQFDTIGRERAKRLDLDNTAAAPAPPPRRLPGEPLGSPLKCLQCFNVCGDYDGCMGGLHCLSAVDVSDCGNILVIDSHTMDVHMFNLEGARTRRSFKVLGIRGGCFWTEERLVLATHRGLRIVRTDGSLEAEFSLGSVINAKRYQLGFIAVQRDRLSIFNGIGKNVRESRTIVKTRSPGLFKRTKNFGEIADVSVDNRRQLVVLDIGRDEVCVINEKGIKQMKITALRQSCGSIRFATSIVVDRNNNILVSDGGSKRLLHFQSCGIFRSFLLNFSVQVGGVDVEGAPSVYGVAAMASGPFIVAISGDSLAELRIYSSL